MLVIVEIVSHGRNSFFQKLSENRLWNTLGLLLLAGLLLRAGDSVERGELRAFLGSLPLQTQTNFPGLVANFLTLLISTFMLLGLCLSKSKILKFTSLLIFFITFALDCFCLKTQGQGVQLPVIYMLKATLGEYAQNEGLLRQLLAFLPQFKEALWRSAIVSCGIFLAGVVFKPGFSPRVLLLLPITFCLTYGAATLNAGKLVTALAPFKMPVLLVYAWRSEHYQGPREIVQFTPGSTDINKVLFILDESVRGDYLSINGFAQATTPYLESQQATYINLGLASSVSNCSWSSDIILRSGLQSNQLPDENQLSLKQPSIFQYATRAGYKTYFLDAQMEAGDGYLLNEFEANFISGHFRLPSKNKQTPELNDLEMGQLAADLLNKNEKVFIMLRKQGAHVPYEQMYPKDYSPPGVAGSEYGTALAWSVDHFFTTLLDQFQASGALILYTSDHGQSFHENSANLTHCDWLTPSSSQASVPLLIFGTALDRYFSGNTAQLKDRLSQFQVFSSLLVWMGYSEAEITKQYGPALWSLPQEPRQFLSGNVFGGYGYKLNTFDPQTFPAKQILE